tara:strand:- start:1432 stop:1737 length:306 start_codon:yes stop_codon:yes gene_type:complete
MNRSRIVIFAPAVSGLVLLSVVFFNLYLFKAGAIEVRTMLALEVPVLLIGFLSCFVSLIGVVCWLFMKQWRTALYCAASVIVFLASYLVAGVNGGAFLNAT